MNEEENQAFKVLHFYNSEDYGTEELKKYIKIIVNLVEKQQKQIKILKDNLVEERAFCKSTLETLKNCVDKDYLHKMISFKDGEIEKLKEAYQTLKDEYKREVFEHQEFVEDTKVAVQDYIKKDEIKEKMRGEINKSWRNTEQRKCQLYAYDILKELLGE